MRARAGQSLLVASATLASLLVLLACTSSNVARERVADPAIQVGRGPIVEDTALRALTQAESVTGTIALLHEDASEVVCSDAARCQQRVLPASTFKIPNALIGLETGVISDADFVIPWDGVVREFADWNRDLDLRAAIRVSAVPYFQELARRVGAEREAAWTRALAYGNGATGGAAQVDTFWLEGPLAISAAEQVMFLRRFARGELPVSARATGIVRDILVLAERDGAVLRGKTGWAHPHAPDQLGWFVGFVEAGPRRSYVAVLVQPSAGQVDAEFLAARRRIAERALSTLGTW